MFALKLFLKVELVYYRHIAHLPVRWRAHSSSSTLVYWWEAAIFCLAPSSPSGMLLNPINSLHPLGWLQEMQL